MRLSRIGASSRPDEITFGSGPPERSGLTPSFLIKTRFWPSAICPSAGRPWTMCLQSYRNMVGHQRPETVPEAGLVPPHDTHAIGRESIRRPAATIAEWLSDENGTDGNGGARVLLCCLRFTSAGISHRSISRSLPGTSAEFSNRVLLPSPTPRWAGSSARSAGVPSASRCQVDRNTRSGCSFSSPNRP
jgi:hypothetical protein